MPRYLVGLYVMMYLSINIKFLYFILQFDELFHPYTQYCLEQTTCQLYCKEKDHENEYFKMYLAVSDLFYLYFDNIFTFSCKII